MEAGREVSPRTSRPEQSSMRNCIRIMIATVYENYGGSAKVLLSSAEALRREFDVNLRAPFDQATSRSQLAFPIETLSTFAMKLGVVPLLIRLLVVEWRHVSRNRPDIVYIHDTPSLIVYGLIARLLRLKVVYHVHGAEGRGPSLWLRDWLTDCKLYVARFLVDPAWPGPWFLIANSVTVPKVVAGGRTRKKRLYLAASISDRKNQILAVEILSEMRRRGHDASLHLCGPILDADYYIRLEAAILAQGMEDHVLLEGVLPPAEIYGRADVVLCPSKFEAQPLVFLEALAAGVPVVASRISAHTEIVETAGLNAGAILAELTAQAFADRIERLEPAYFSEVKAHVATLYAPERFAGKLVEVFRELAGGKE